MVNKKLLVIFVLLCLLLSNIGNMVCFADTTTNYEYNVTNNSVTNVYMTNSTQSSTINTLYTNGYRSIFSRYTNNTIHCKINISGLTQIMGYYTPTNSGSSNNAYAFLQDYYNNDNLFEDMNNILSNFNGLEVSNLTMNYETLTCGMANYVFYPYLNNITIEFDLSLKNLQMLKSGYGASINFSSIALRLMPSAFTYNGYNYYLSILYLRGSPTFKFTYSYDNQINNVDGMVFTQEISLYSTESDTFNEEFAFSSNTYDNTASNVTANLSNATIYFSAVNYTLVDNSSYLSNSIYAVRDSVNFQAGFSYFSGDSTGDILLNISLHTPLFYNNNSNYIVGNSNNFSNLELSYYDCEWYELHYQLANAFIFLVTEFPIISDVTNLIYSLFVMIVKAFNVLLEFSEFGFLFGFGMFAIIFGVILKMILGD